MSAATPLVSICLPVYNGAETVTEVAESVLAQKYGDLELIISDNASTDDTEALCRDLARADGRVRYHRNPSNVGLLNNFVGAARLARGEYLRWIGDSDRLEPEYVARCVEVFAADPRLLLVTTGMSYAFADGRVWSDEYVGTGLGSDDPADRAVEMVRLLTQPYSRLDPLYAMMRREPVVAIGRRNMLREDQVFAVKLALAGPWAHIPEILAQRSLAGRPVSTRSQAQRLAVPRWQSHFANTLQLAELLRAVRDAGLTAAQRQRVRAAILRMYRLRQQWTVVHRSRKLLRLARLSR